MLQKKQLWALGKTIGIFVLAVAMIVFPQEVLSSATQGIIAWAKYVLPALLPFFILSELLMGVGIVHLLGVLLEPVMRPVFRLPGSAAFVVAMGFTSGPPIGAVLTAKLKKEKLLTRREAERLLVFTNNSSPGFVLGTVAAGMFNNPALGLVLAFSNYLANLLLGVGLRFYGSNEKGTPRLETSEISIWRRSFRAMIIAQRKDGRPLGQLIGDSIRNSINTILIVGGFLLFFSVLIRLLSILGILSLFTSLMEPLLKPLGLSASLYPAVSSGLFEITLGTKAAAEATAPFLQQVVLISGLLAWSGISVHAQVASFISGTDIRFTPFMVGRVIQTALACIITFYVLSLTGSVPVFNSVNAGLSAWQLQLMALLLAVFCALALGLILILAYAIFNLCLRRLLGALR